MKSWLASGCEMIYTYWLKKITACSTNLSLVMSYQGDAWNTSPWRHPGGILIDAWTTTTGSFWCEKQWLYSKSVSHDWATCPIAKGKPSNPIKENNFHNLYLWPRSFGYYPMTIGEDRKKYSYYSFILFLLIDCIMSCVCWACLCYINIISFFFFFFKK